MRISGAATVNNARGSRFEFGVRRVGNGGWMAWGSFVLVNSFIVLQSGVIICNENGGGKSQAWGRELLGFGPSRAHVGPIADGLGIRLL